MWPLHLAQAHTSLNQMRPNNCELNSMNDSWRSGRHGPRQRPASSSDWKSEKAMNMHETLNLLRGMICQMICI